MARARCLVGLVVALALSTRPLSALSRPVTPAGHLALPVFEINLDAAPEERYAEVLKHAQFNATIWEFYERYFEKDVVLSDVIYSISARRGAEQDAEFQRELDGLAVISGLPRKFVQAVQMIYELQTLMVPVVNGSVAAVDTIPTEYQALSRIPWRGPGCTGVVATTEDGTVYHARNLDFSPYAEMKKLMYVAVFTRKGQEVYRSQMAVGYPQVITVMRRGPDGYTLERNTRFSDRLGCNEETIKNLMSGRPLNGWSLRKVAEEATTYDDALRAVASTPYCSPEYNILSGVRKGNVVSKDQDAVAHLQTLGAPGRGEKKSRPDYVIMTNFDFFNGDIREHFDPTAGGGGLDHPSRREAAEAYLARWAPGTLTPDALFGAVNAPYVLAKDTVFQMLASVEHDSWNATQPVLRH